MLGPSERPANKKFSHQIEHSGRRSAVTTAVLIHSSSCCSTLIQVQSVSLFVVSYRFSHELSGAPQVQVKAPLCCHLAVVPTLYFFNLRRWNVLGSVRNLISLLSTAFLVLLIFPVVFSFDNHYYI